MRRGEIYRTREAPPERGHKPGYYVVVSRDFIAAHDQIATVVCAPVYSEVLGIPTEIILEPAQGVHHRSAVRCDFLMLMFKSRLTSLVGALSSTKLRDLDLALRIALDLEVPR